MSSTPPTFVQRGLEFPQPVIAEGMEMYSFVIRGSLNNLQALCDRYLNGPSNGAVDYRPLTETIMISITGTKKIRSGDPEYIDKGFVTEREAAFWVLVENTKQPVTGEVCFFVPYIYIDSPYAMSAGREIFGFAKEIGICAFPENPGAADKLSFDVWAIEKFAPDASPARMTLLEMARTQTGLVQKVEQALQTAADALAGFVRGLTTNVGETEVAILFSALKSIALMQGPQCQMVLLKQFRHVVDGREACYQAIVKFPATSTKVTDLQFLPTYKVTVNQFQSHPIVDTLGLQLQNGSADTMYAFYFSGDMTIGNGQIIWEAS